MLGFASAIVDTNALWKIIVASLAGGAGCAIAFGILLLGLSRGSTTHNGGARVLSYGVVLLAGNGHARRDIGVPRWLGVDGSRVFSVGYLEEADDGSTPISAFDAVVRTQAAERRDPCADFRAPLDSMR